MIKRVWLPHRHLYLTSSGGTEVRWFWPGQRVRVRLMRVEKTLGLLELMFPIMLVFLAVEPTELRKVYEPL